MKATEVLRRYAAGERNFQRVNIRGQSFKGQDLSGADFSEADIRSSNFTGTTLKGTKFSGTKCGLQNFWIFFLIVFVLLLLVLSGFLVGLSGGLIGSLLGGFAPFNSNNSIVFIIGSVTLLVLGIFFATIIRQNLEIALGIGGFSLAVTVVIAVAIAYSGNGTGMQTVPIILASSVSLAGAECGISIIILATALSITVTGKSTLIFTLKIPCISALNGIEAGLRSARFPGILASEFSKIIAGAETLAIIGFSAYLGWYFLQTEDKDTFTRWIAVMISAIQGTSFRSSDLTEADFTGSQLKNTDFRNAILTRTCFRNAKKLDLARPGKTYLKNFKLQQWLIGTGQDINFDSMNLRGVNFQGKILTDASFIGADLSEANLQDADLSRAKLVQTQLDKTDFTGATLTGAFIEDWNITVNTKLRGVRCDYIYLRLPTQENPDPHRKPDNCNENFADRDFEDFIKPIFDTLDLYHNQNVDPRAISLAWKNLAENNPNAELEIVAMEKRGQDKFLLRAKTAPQADKSQLNAEYFAEYNQLKAISEADKKLLAEKDNRIQKLENMVMTAIQSPKFNVQGEIEMNNAPSRIQKFTNSTINNSGAGAFSLGDIKGTVPNTINQLPSPYNPKEPGIKELLTQLQQAVDDPNLSEEDQKQALEQLQALVEAGQNPENKTMQKKSKKAVGFLKVIAEGIKPTTQLAQACGKVLPKILLFFEL
ncbi:MAG: pentapeptide repeat-containing protein [Xenococcus sp. (in: cyanobacteria)]